MTSAPPQSKLRRSTLPVWAALVVCAALVAMMIAAGCGGDDDEGSAPSSAGEASGTTGAGGPSRPNGAGTDEAGDGGQSGSAGRGGAEITTGEKTGGEASAEDLVRGAIEGFFVSGDPETVCTKLATDELIRNTYGDAKGCRQAQRQGGAARSVRMSGLEISGETATVSVTPRGGPSDGVEIDATLVRDGDQWRIDSLESDVPPGP